jgi:ATP-dependent RNA helicase RhlE
LAKGEVNNKSRNPRALVLAPTRELAIQIGEEFRLYSKYMHLRHTVIFGGVSQKAQATAMHRGVDILVATPGRLLDLMQQRIVKLGEVKYLVLDEADRMLDMGFVRDVRKIIAALPQERQSLLFSATMPGEVGKLSGDLLYKPVRVEVTPQATPVERIKQCVHHVSADGKRKLLEDILSDPAYARVIVFSRTKHRANRVAMQLTKAGIEADAIHGNKSQGARQRALKSFRTGDIRVLVATDIAARGIDVDGITHVINFELPNEPESYVHRIGRTARAGASGAAISFCDNTERLYLRDIEKLLGAKIKVIGDEPVGEPVKPPTKSRNNRGGRPGHSPKKTRHRSGQGSAHRKGGSNQTANAGRKAA